MVIAKDYVETALNALISLSRSFDGEGIEIDIENEYNEHIIKYGEARKIAKAKKYSARLIVLHWKKVYEPNDKTILEFLSNAANHKNKDTDALIIVDEDPIIKVSAKFIKMLTQEITERIAYMKSSDYDSDTIDELKEALKELKSFNKVSKKKDADKTEKIAEAKANAKALKKIASDAKKAADVAQKNYEKAEAVVAKLKL